MPREAAIWFGIAWPAAITILARLSMVLTDLAFLGHLSTDALAAASSASVRAPHSCVQIPGEPLAAVVLSVLAACRFGWE